MTAAITPLRQLAALHGVQNTYHGIDREWKTSRTDTLVSILRALGAPVNTPDDAPTAVRECRQQQWRNISEPVVLAWDGTLESIALRVPEALERARITGHLFLEGGAEDELALDLHEAPTVRRVTIEGSVYVQKRVPLAAPPFSTFAVPDGYHRLVLEIPGNNVEVMVIAAPTRVYQPDTSKHGWGAFMPLYSLHSRQGWPAGDLNDLKRLVDWVAAMGGNTVASLPLLATFLETPYEPSPYLPISKLFWNEFYLDMNTLPELAKCPTAREMLASPALAADLGALRREPLVDYGKQMWLKRPVLEELARRLGDAARGSPEYVNYLQEHPEADSFARFRAAVRKQGTSWRQWPHRARAGDLREGEDYTTADCQYYSYAQFLTHERIKDAVDHASATGVRLYLDMPLGVHPDGYDTWRHRDLFATGVTVGAPPDAVFVRGQNWAFPPLHPTRLRQTGYRYAIDSLRHHLRRASVLRIDHVMGLHRLFMIPDGAEATQGMYVHYHPEEMYAILSLESHRHRAVIVGEDLGIVPTAVRTAMRRHGLQRMYVLHYELAAPADPLLTNPPTDAVASINTHDMPPFASFWSGQDITERRGLGILNDHTARVETVYRAFVKNRLLAFLRKGGWLRQGSDAESVLRACLTYLAGSDAWLTLVNLEDLWLAPRVQNYPSTSREYPNWRQRAQYDLEAFCQMPQVTSILREVDGLRKAQGTSDAASRQARKGRERRRH